MGRRKWCFFAALCMLLVLPLRVGAAGNYEEDFQSLNKMKLKELTVRAKALLDKKFPGEKWESHKFPKYVYINDSVLAGYKIAVKAPALLAQFPCYCFCEEMGHKNLAYCFLKNGALGQFDDHASGCNICDAEAMHVFLWNDLKVPRDRMLQALKEIYGQ
jgi:hypothetical protein